MFLSSVALSSVFIAPWQAGLLTFVPFAAQADWNCGIAVSRLHASSSSESHLSLLAMKTPAFLTSATIDIGGNVFLHMSVTEELGVVPPAPAHARQLSAVAVESVP